MSTPQLPPGEKADYHRGHIPGLLERAKRLDEVAQALDQTGKRDHYAHYRRKAFDFRELARECHFSAREAEAENAAD